MLAFRHRADEHNQYWCRTFTEGKEVRAKRAAEEGEREVRHTILSVADFDGFLDNLMTVGFANIIALLRDEASGSDVRVRLQQLEDEAQRERKRVEEMRAEAEANEDLARVRDPDEDDANHFLQKALKRNVVLHQAEARVKEIEANLEAIKKRQEQLLTSGALVELEREGAGWYLMTPDQKRLFLLKIFEPFQVEGEPPHEVLVGRLRTFTRKALRPVPIITKVKGTMRLIRRSYR
jgi:hypothetical protein